MSKTLLVFLTLLPLTLSAQDQETTPTYPNGRAILKLAPMYLFESTVEVGLEAFNKKFNQSIDGSIGYRWGGYDYRNAMGFNAELAYRRYFSPMKLRVRKEHQFYQGFFFGLGVRASSYGGEEGDPTYTVFRDIQIRSVAPNAIVGIHRTIWQKLFVDVHVGVGYTFTEVDAEGYSYYPFYRDGFFDIGYEGFYPKVGAKLGIGL